jgi:hypothetical protein
MAYLHTGALTGNTITAGAVVNAEEITPAPLNAGAIATKSV